MKIQICNTLSTRDCFSNRGKRLMFLVSIAILVITSCTSNSDSPSNNSDASSYPTDELSAISNFNNDDENNDLIINLTAQPEHVILAADLKFITNLSQRCVMNTNNITLPEHAEPIGFIRNGEEFALGKLTTSFSWEVIPATQYGLPLGFSPNAKQMAFLVRQNHSVDLLRIVDSTTVLVEYEMDFPLNTNSQWFNNEHLILIPNESMKQKYLFNPFTNEKKPFPYFPTDRVDERFTNVYWFNPQGTQVVYLETDEDYRSYYSSEKHIIYDTESGEKIETGLSWVISPPAWSPDGNYLAVVSLGRLHVMRQIPSQEIFLVEAATGQSQQISNFFELFEGVFIGSLTWSPDGRYLLFELDLIDDSLPESFEPSLYLFDLQTQHIIDLCWDDVSESAYRWSPDGQMIGWHSRSGDLYLLDVTTGNLLHQSQPEAGLIGWLAIQTAED